MHNPKADFLRRAIPQCDPIFALEIGCLRTPSEDATDGWSTYHIAEELRKRGGSFFMESVDLSWQAVEMATQVMSQAGLLAHWKGIVDDGVARLSNGQNREICFLYLDSSDDPHVTLGQAMAAHPHMTEHGIIVIDDVQPIGGNYFGKGELAIPFLVQKGWRCLIEPTLWQGEHCWAMAKLWREP